MIKNFIKVTLRNIAGHKVFAAINIFGLSIGIACALIIALYINHELKYDKFHSDVESIHRVTLYGKLRGIEFRGATSSAKVAKHLGDETRDVSEILRITRLGAWLIANDSVRFNEDNLLFVDANFFAFFDGFEVLEGNAEEMLKDPRSIVLTDESAFKYFGTTSGLIGKTLKVETREKPYKITGIIKTPPKYSHIQFDMLASFNTFEKLLSMSWASNNVYTYVKIHDNVKEDSVVNALNRLYEKYIREEMTQNYSDVFSSEDIYQFNLQKLTDIHLHSNLEAELQPNGNAVYVYSLGIIAILILVIACLNFMNLSTANSTNRSFEVSLRKVVGANKVSLVGQFLVESIIVSFIALIFALLLAEILLPYFNTFLGLELEFGLIANFGAVTLILVVTTFLGILAGIYPAFFIASFNPVEILSNKFVRGLRSSKIRAIFVVLQFFISIVIVVLTVVIFSQVKFMLNKELGFNKENVLVIRRSDALEDNLSQFKKEIAQLPEVLNSTNSNSIPGRDFYLNAFKLRGTTESSAILFNQVFVNYDFFETFELKLEKGRFFDGDVASDTFACVLNQRAVDLLGLSYPIGSELIQPTMVKHKAMNYKVIGVVQDFHYQGLSKAIEPLVICLMPGNWEGYLNVRIDGPISVETLASIEKVWYKYAPEYPFVYFNLDEDFNKNYEEFIMLGRVFIIFSFLAIFVACLGLYGLIAHTANQRVREIGIRKSLGASVITLVGLLSGEVVKLLLFSTVLAWLAAYFIIEFWLADFYYKIGVTLYPFLLGLLVVIAVVLPTLLYHAFKTARTNPGISLKYE